MLRIRAEHLAIARAGLPLAAGLSFTLERREALVVLGANGSGKSTLLRTLAGLLPAAAGSVRLEGGGEDWPDIAAACHYFGHLNAMKPVLTVEENLEFWQRFQGAPAVPVAAALERLGLAHARTLPYAYLSTGQKRRAAAAKLLLNHRPVWLLDEPTAGLDAAAAETFAQLMRDHLAADGLLVAATHAPLGLDDARTLELADHRARPHVAGAES